MPVYRYPYMDSCDWHSPMEALVGPRSGNILAIPSKHAPESDPAHPQGMTPQPSRYVTPEPVSTGSQAKRLVTMSLPPTAATSEHLPPVVSSARLLPRVLRHDLPASHDVHLVHEVQCLTDGLLYKKNGDALIARQTLCCLQ